jgi:arginyl-tRNA synthetase
MLERLRHELTGAIAGALKEMGVAEPAVALEVPPRRDLGDLAWAGALPLAKLLRMPPRAIAEGVVSRVEPALERLADLLEPRARIDGPGFVNFRLRRGPVLARLLSDGLHQHLTEGKERGKVIVEHTNINPNKAAHIGHLRNAVLGDALVRCLRWLGRPVEVQNYVDDTGVQVADVVVGLLYLPESDLARAVAPVWPEVASSLGTSFRGPDRRGIREGGPCHDAATTEIPPPASFGRDDAGAAEIAPATGEPATQEPGARRLVLETLVARTAGGTLVSGNPGVADFDDLCWELYPTVTRRYEADPAFAARRTEVLHAIEAGFPDALSLAEAVATLVESLLTSPIHEGPATVAIARLAAAVADANLRCHLATMGRLGIPYDVLPHESDILQRGFWKRALALLQASGAIRLEEEGKNAGCWVMSLADSPEFAGMADADKILVRSNGTVTYTGKDIAYQLWKLGFLTDPDGTRHDFGYRTFARWGQDGPAAPVLYGGGDHDLLRTSADPGERPAGATFGAGERVYNVIDVRQSYPQKVVKEAIRVLGHPQAADNSVHFAYEMVALTPAAVRRLEASQGLDLALTEDEMGKAFVEMSGRRGIGVKADALLDTLLEEAAKAIAARQGDAGPYQPDVRREGLLSSRPSEASGGTWEGAAGSGHSPAEIPRRSAPRNDTADSDVAGRARDIATGALRYQMLRQGKNRVLAFDFDEALAFEGDTGPYLQYSAVRARKIFAKLATQGLAGSVEEDARAAAASEVPDDLWELAYACARTPEMVAKTVGALEFSLLAGHARDLAQAFHKLYHEHPVLHAEDEATRALRRATFRLFATTIAEILEPLLGIPVPEEM